MVKKIVLLASGNGSNVENICRFFQQDPTVSVKGVYTNNPKAGVLQRLKAFDMEGKIFDKVSFTNGVLLEEIQQIHPDLIVLAGFLWKMGKVWIQTFPNQIINIHPALLPKYGGKGMYGLHVHQAVSENNEPETGITIHYVNEEYDQGDFIFQKRISISKNDSPTQIAEKVHQLEYDYLPQVIRNLLKKQSDEI
jgi:phosphoribosylglycinamide formyltransferase-1